MTTRLIWFGLSACLLLCMGAGLVGCTAHVKTETSPADISAPQPVSPDLDDDGHRADPSWYACRQDDDCVIEEGMCEELTAINRNHRLVFNQFRDYWNGKLGCKTYATPTGPRHGPGRCLKNRCALPAATKNG